MNIARRASEWYVSRSFTFRLLSAVWMVFILLVLCAYTAHRSTPGQILED